MYHNRLNTSSSCNSFHWLVSMPGMLSSIVSALAFTMSGHLHTPVSNHTSITSHHASTIYQRQRQVCCLIYQHQHDPPQWYKPVTMSSCSTPALQISRYVSSITIPSRPNTNTSSLTQLQLSSYHHEHKPSKTHLPSLGENLLHPPKYAH